MKKTILSMALTGTMFVLLTNSTFAGTTAFPSTTFNPKEMEDIGHQMDNAFKDLDRWNSFIDWTESKWCRSGK